MKTLADLLNFVVTTLQSSPLCSSVRVLETQEFSTHRFAFKIRAQLASSNVLQVRLYCNGEHTDYAYQLLRGEEPILRWDNKEHFPLIASHPHHFHTATGQIEASPLIGDPDHDLFLVLQILATV